MNPGTDTATLAETLTANGFPAYMEHMGGNLFTLTFPLTENPNGPVARVGIGTDEDTQAWEWVATVDAHPEERGYGWTANHPSCPACAHIDALCYRYETACTDTVDASGTLTADRLATYTLTLARDLARNIPTSTHLN